MFRSILFHMSNHCITCTFRRKLAVFRRKGKHLMTSMFDSTGFMHIDMAGIGTQDTLIRAKDRRDDCNICLGTSYKEMYISLRCPTDISDKSGCLLAIYVFSISGSLLKIGLYQSFQNSRMRSLAVITLKLNHRNHICQLQI